VLGAERGAEMGGHRLWLRHRQLAPTLQRDGTGEAKVSIQACEVAAARGAGASRAQATHTRKMGRGQTSVTLLA
jgi:hypothetical protein